MSSIEILEYTGRIFK